MIHRAGILFLIQLSKYLGFYPSNNYSESYPYFDMVNGIFVDYIPSHGCYSKKDISLLLSKFINIGFSNYTSLELNRTLRVQLLQLLVDYYHLHIHGMSDIKSLTILKELFDWLPLLSITTFETLFVFTRKSNIKQFYSLSDY